MNTVAGLSILVAIVVAQEEPLTLKYASLVSSHSYNVIASSLSRVYAWPAAV